MTRRSRKRTLLMVLLLLTGGAIINVAVAWAIAYTVQFSDYGDTLESNTIMERPVHITRAFGSEYVWVQPIDPYWQAPKSLLDWRGVESRG